MSKEACRIIITEEPARWVQGKGLVPSRINVSAPMKYKELCYNILDDTRRVIELTADRHFFNPNRTLLITMNVSGLVDAAAPLPPREWCYMVLKQARLVIEQFEAQGQPVEAGHADCLPSV